MARYIKNVNIALQDPNADGTPERMYVTYEIRDSVDKTLRSNGRFEQTLNPFDSAVALNHAAIVAIALRENIHLAPSSSSSTTP